MALVQGGLPVHAWPQHACARFPTSPRRARIEASQQLGVWPPRGPSGSSLSLRSPQCLSLSDSRWGPPQEGLLVQVAVPTSTQGHSAHGLPLSLLQEAPW